MTTGNEWWNEHDNVVRLARWMAGNPIYTKDEMAYMIEKPWKFEEEWLTCQVQDTLEDMHDPLPF